jgi:alpha-tubulin suppressor-like RCC1 family protein
MKVALIDYNIQETFKSSLKSDVAPVMIETDDTFVSLFQKISAVEGPITNVMIAQHSKPFLCIGTEMIMFEDETTRAGLKQFLIDLKSIGVVTVDFMACLLFAQPGVPEMFAQLEAETGVDLRASTDDTGNVEVGGNWMLESDMADVQDLYFSQAISEFKELFFITWWGGKQYNGSSRTFVSTLSAFATIDANKNVLAWGASANGGIIQTSSIKVRIGNATTGEFLSNITNVYSNNQAFAAVDASKNVYVWGSSSFGGMNENFATQLRIGNAITGELLTNITNVYSTQGAFAAVDTSNNVYVWGQSFSGGINTGFATRVRIANATTGIFLSNLTKIYSTSSAFAAVDTSNNVYVWGNSSNGGIATGFATQVRIANATTGLFITNVINIYSTEGAFAGVDASNNVYVWGSSSYGGIAAGFATRVRIANATTGEFLTTVTNVYSNNQAFAAVDDSKNLYVWGSSSYGGIATGFATQLRIANATTGEFLTNVTNVYSNSSAFAAVNASNNLYAWGDMFYGGIASGFATQVKNGSSGPFLTNITNVYSLAGAFAAVDASKNVYAWSFGQASQLRMGYPYGDTFLTNVTIYSHNNSFALVDASTNVYEWSSGDSVTQIKIGNTTTGPSLTNITNIYANAYAFAAVDTSNNIYVWGNSTHGGIDFQYASPLQISSINTINVFTNVYSNSFGTAFAAVDASNTVYAWGSTSVGGINEIFATPVKIGNATTGRLLTNVTNIYSNQNAFAAVDASKNVYVWGSSSNGGITTNFATQLRIGNATTGEFLSNITNVYSNNQAFAAVDASNNIYAWGASFQGGIATNFATQVRIDNSTTGEFLTNITNVYSKSEAFAIVDASNNVYVWGSFSYGGMNENFAVRVRIANATTGEFLSNITNVYSNQYAFAAVDASNNVYVWGSSSYGGIASGFATQLRIGNATTGEFLSNITNVYSNPMHYAFAALDASKNVYVWGSSSYGGIATGFATQVRIANATTGLFLTNVTNVYASQYTFAVVDASNNLYVWGNPGYGGINVNFATQVRIGNSTTGIFLTNITNVYLNPNAFAAVDASNNVYAWGSSSNGGITSSFYATQVRIGSGGPFLTNVTNIYSAERAFAAVDASNNIYAWGDTSTGGIATGFATQVKIGNATTGPFVTNITNVSSNRFVFAAITDSNNIYAWGSSAQGGLTSPYASSLVSLSATASNAETYVPGVDPVVLDATSASLAVYKNIYNLNETKNLTVSATGGDGAFTYAWSGDGVVSSTQGTARVRFREGVSGEIITVLVTSGPRTATKTFTITYSDPVPVPFTSFGTPLNTGVLGITEDNRLVATLATGFSSFVSESANVSVYTPPAGQEIVTLAAKLTESTNASGYLSISFDVDKYTANGTKVESILGTTTTYGSMSFDISAGRTCVVAWKNSLGETYTMATYNSTSSPAIQNYNAATLTLASTSSGRNYFSYFGPNSETVIVANPLGVSGIPCFVAGTRILTPAGEKLVDNLKTGDLILTADGRKLPATIYSTHLHKTTKETAPYLIPANAFRAHFPPQDICLSPKHAIQSGKGIWEIPQFAEGRFPAIQKTRVGEAVTYYHIELPNFFTDNLIANGSICESLGTKVQSSLPKGHALYSFNKKANGFVRYNPSESASKSK